MNDTYWFLLLSLGAKRLKRIWLTPTFLNMWIMLSSERARLSGVSYIEGFIHYLSSIVGNEGIVLDVSEVGYRSKHVC